MNRTAIAVAAGLALWAGAAPRGAFASGMTTHAVAAGRTIAALRSDDLRSLIHFAISDYYNGVMWPDAIMEKMKEDGKQDADQLSHDRERKEGKKIGWAQEFLDLYRKECPWPASSSKVDCTRTLAFLMGSISHLVVDGPWHAEFIDHASRFKCHPIIQGEAKNQWRHMIADTNVDYCLERRTRPLGRVDHDTTERTYQPARYMGKPGALGCDGRSFYDLRKGGECWECPKDANRTAYPITTLETLDRDGDAAEPSSKGCVFPVHEKFKKARKLRKNTYVAQGCPGGYFWDVMGGDGLLGACYSCDGYNRTAYPIDHNRSCSKLVPERLVAAAFVRKSGVCGRTDKRGEDYSKHQPMKPGWAFLDLRGGGECWACPDGFDRTALAITTSDKTGNNSEPAGGGCWKSAITLPCRSIPLNTLSSAKRPIVVSDASGGTYKMLAAAYQAERTRDSRVNSGFLDKDYAVKALESFRSKYNSQGLGPAALGVESYGDKCPWIYSNWYSGDGGIEDGIEDTVAVMESLWENLKAGKEIGFVRTGTYTYATVLDGKELVKTRGHADY